MPEGLHRLVDGLLVKLMPGEYVAAEPHREPFYFQHAQFRGGFGAGNHQPDCVGTGVNGCEVDRFTQRPFREPPSIGRDARKLGESLIIYQGQYLKIPDIECLNAFHQSLVGRMIYLFYGSTNRDH